MIKIYVVDVEMFANLRKLRWTADVKDYKEVVDTTISAIYNELKDDRVVEMERDSQMDCPYGGDSVEQM